MPRFPWSLLRQPPSIQEFGLHPMPQGPRLEVRLELLNPVQQLCRQSLRQSPRSCTMMSDSLHQSFLVGPVAIRLLWLCSSVLLCDWFASPVLLVLSPAVMASGSHPLRRPPRLFNLVGPKILKKVLRPSDGCFSKH